jgi:hypothetical protein
MTDTLEELKPYSIETIYQETKNPSQCIKSLLVHEFSPFVKVRFLGFVSIIERDFYFDLSRYKKELDTVPKNL